MSNSVISPEERNIDYIPRNERHGKARSLFTLWFGANLQVTTIAAGGTCVAVGLSLPWALLACLIGHLVGAVFMALHSSQDPVLGIPQMIQSRAQFGYYGAIIPVVLVVLMYVGFFAVTGVQGGAALSSMTNVDLTSSTVIVTIITILVTIFGYKLAHFAQRWLSLINGIAFIYLSYKLMANPGFTSLWVLDSFSWKAFSFAVAICATWQLAYAPYVADFSRYLPEDTNFTATYWYTYLGSVFSSLWMFAIGAICVCYSASTFDGGSIEFLINQADGNHWFFYLVVVSGVIAINSMNLYGMFMSVITTLHSFWQFKVSGAVRITHLVTLAAASTALGLMGQGDFLQNFMNLIFVIAYLIIPWTAINLADFFLIRKEQYVVEEFFNPTGEYGGIDWRAMIPFFLGVAVEVPFISSDFFVGPAAALIGGADISWVFGLLVSGGLYVTLMRQFPIRAAYPPVEPWSLEQAS